MSLPRATLATILEGVGVLMSVTSTFGACAMTIAVLLHKSSEETNRWFQVGTAFGFSLGVPLTILFLIFQRIF